MSSINSRQAPFIKKISQMLSNPDYEQIVRWDSTHTIIDIIDPIKMEEKVLPYLFRHNKYSSFVRQLNLYGFKKSKNTGVNQFAHPELKNEFQLNSIVSKRVMKKNSKQKQKIQEVKIIQYEIPNQIAQRNLKIQQIKEQNITPIYNNISLIIQNPTFSGISLCPSPYLPITRYCTTDSIPNIFHQHYYYPNIIELMNLYSYPDYTSHR